MNLELVNAAVAANHIRQETDKVVISEKASPNGKAAEKTYTRYTALDAQGMAALCNGKIEPATPKPETGDDVRTEEQKAPGACDYFNYGYDLDVRASTRASLMSDLEGPEKAIKKAVDALVASGFDATQARDLVIAQRKATGLAV